MPDPPEKQQLEAILSRAAEGDESAWRQIIETYTPRVFGLLRAQCNNADLAEELTQATFVTMAAKIGSYTELGKFEAWLFRIAMNRLRDEMRRQQRHARPVDDQSLIGLAGSDDQAGAAADPENVEIRRLRTAMTRLSASEQQIIHLRHHAELSFKQIAEMLDQPLGTVLARQHRALKKLRDLLGEREEEK